MRNLIVISNDELFFFKRGISSKFNDTLNILDALQKKYEAQMSTAEANLKVLLENPVGVGDHPDIVETIEKEVEKIADAHDKIEAIKNLL